MAQFVKKMVNGHANPCFLLDLPQITTYYCMKYLVVSIVLFFCTLQTFGQQEYFIYLQTENNQAFYLRAKDTVYSSTASGYLILSKLQDSTRTVTIGFAKNAYHEQQFNIPANKKDAGYLIKNFGDKGWGLFNLQTLAVIMSSTPPEEKKSPEITGERKNDPFSMLLANAVNDTAVLYVAARPKKPTSLAVAPVDEKKKDSLLQKQEQAKKDSALVAREIIAAADSAVAVQRKKDSLAAKAIADNKLKKDKAARDSAAVTKAAVPPTKNAVVKNTSPATGKNVSKPRKDSIVIINNPPAVKNAVAKNGKERKDTIIMMSGRQPANNSVVKNTVTTNKPVLIKKDTQHVKQPETIVKPEEKTVALNKTPVPVQNDNTNKKDSVVKSIEPKTDSVGAPPPATVVQAKPLADTPVTVVKRTGPLITKAAELFTDTSYVAVFVDESKDVFDTVRISIPFNEILLRAGQSNTITKETKQAAEKKDSSPVANADIPTVEKKDTPVAIVKNDTARRTDTVIKDTVKVAIATTIPPAQTIKKDTPISKLVDSTRAIVQNTKKDSSVPEIADSGRAIKPPAQTVMVNSDCKEIAWDSDIDKLRIKMLVVSADDERIALAKKVFRQKCFSVKQVRALSELFNSDEGKYKWFDAVYPFVTDSGNFSSLGELIKSDYYLNRFKAMLRN